MARQRGKNPMDPSKKRDVRLGVYVTADEANRLYRHVLRLGREFSDYAREHLLANCYPPDKEEASAK